MSDNLLNKLTQLKLPAMAGSLIRQRETPQTYGELSFEERLILLADDELLNRENGRVARLRKSANLKYQAAPEGLHYPVSRGLRAEQMRELLNGHYITHRKNILITGRRGVGKAGSPMLWVSRPVARNTAFSTGVPVGYWKCWRRAG
uniref:IstB domain protein ATP-binding protein n=1 Tax=Pectobacterium carotovorum TaxID=554 RepID=A0A0N9NLG9_PECCA|nr:IstB domain protein ATP-binding protein [Pectobacterium carotovorum]